MTLPRHIAIVMDGNGRWAEARGLPRYAGHKAGIEPVRMAVRACGELKIQALTLFAFSSENWRRPADEVGKLMELFMQALQDEVAQLHEKSVQLRFIGNRQSLSVRLQASMSEAEAFTAQNTGLQLAIAVGYGGRWDILQAAKALARRCLSGAATVDEIDEESLQAALCTHGLPEP